MYFVDDEKNVSPPVPLFSLGSKHNAVQFRKIDQGHLGRFTESEVDQLTEVGRSTVFVQTLRHTPHVSY